MSALLTLIRQYRVAAGDEILVVHITSFSKDVVPHTRVGGTLMRKAPDEPFESFRSKGCCCGKVMAPALWRSVVCRRMPKCHDHHMRPRSRSKLLSESEPSASLRALHER